VRINDRIRQTSNTYPHICRSLRFNDNDLKCAHFSACFSVMIAVSSPSSTTGIQNFNDPVSRERIGFCVLGRMMIIR
jgi:hypothetical protein